jgi:hypothetical protein
MRWAVLAAFPVVFIALGFSSALGREPLKVASFEFDVTPPLGTPLCEGAVEKAKRIDDPLKCRGIILFTRQRPIILCAVDWVGITGDGHDAWRKALADAAGTSPDRVAVQCLHQHDAPGFDPGAEALMAQRKLPGQGYLPGFDQEVLARASRAVKVAITHPKAVTHLGLGKAEVKEVASNRRVLGPDGMVRHIRWSATRDADARAAPEGIIDPAVRVVSLWNGEQPVVVLSYYATHPQSHHAKGGVSCDFVGIARRLRDEAQPGVLFVHFDGASGNVTAGKYNDGSPENRPVLAHRLADGMARAQADSAAHKAPISDVDVSWRVRRVGLPVAPWIAQTELEQKFAAHPTFALARNLAWGRLRRAGRTIDLTSLQLGNARILHMPGELFVEYQLFAQRLRPDLFVAMAAYGDYGPGYIGTRQAYPQGGYETGTASRVAPEVEDVLVTALRDLLDARDKQTESPSEITATAPRLGRPPKP